MKRLFVWLETIINKHKELKRWKRIVTALAAVITFATTYALILPAITVEKNNTEEVAGMYLGQEDAGTSKEQAAGTHRELEGGQDDLLLENALEFTGVSIAADQENAVSFEYADESMTANATFSTDEDIPEGSELVVNSVDPESGEYADLGSRAAALLDREFIYDVTTCSFYDFALICDGIDVTPKTGLVDVQIVFNDNTVEHVDDAVYAGRFARAAQETDGFVALAADDGGAEKGASAELEKDELVSANPDESAAIELTDGIITALTLKGNDLAESDSLVGLLAGYVDEEAKAEAAETDAEIPDYEDLQEEGARDDTAEVDVFHWGVDSQSYEYHLSGGDSISFRELVEALGIVGKGESLDADIYEEDAETVPEDQDAEADTETAVEEETSTASVNSLNEPSVSDSGATVDSFIADIEKIELSDESPIKAAQITEDTTAGSLIEKLGIECEYSVELTEKQIAALNSKPFTAPDWALIGVKPFVTEEIVTVTMKTGDVFTVSFTDDQVRKNVISASGENYEIKVTYGKNAGIPDGSELKVKEILPKDKRYSKYYEKTLEASKEETPELKDEDSSEVEIVTGAWNSLVDGLFAKNKQEDKKSDSDTVTDNYTRIFDIEIWNGKEKIEPKSAVMVDIKLLDVPDANVTPKVVHFGTEGPEVMDVCEKAAEEETADVSENEEDRAKEITTKDSELFPDDSLGVTEPAVLQFAANEFSVYSIMYTVDFHFDVDGKIYSFSIPGGGYVSLSSIVELLGISKEPVTSEAGNAAESVSNNDSTDQPAADVREPDVLTLDNLVISEATKQFMNNVEDVVFSNTELAWIGKVDESTTVGALKDRLRLECEYSSELTEMQIAQINATKVDAGEWALISLKPFDTEETLRVTMKNGDVFEIKVTDYAQYSPVENDGVTIANPSGTTMNLFDYWVRSDLKDATAKSAWPGYTGNGNPPYSSSNHNGTTIYGTGNNSGINSWSGNSTNGHALKFNPSDQWTVIDGTYNNWRQRSENNARRINSWVGNADPLQGLVQSTLNANGYPQLTTNSSLGTNGENLDYLFDSTQGDAMGKAVYPDVNGLLYVDRDGYYTYDSRDFSAQYNTSTDKFTLSRFADNVTGGPRGFWPFGSEKFWVGLTMDVKFSMPTNGKVLNPSGIYKDMTFSFSGDDDTWIYVDGVLVGDGGGVHNRTQIDINFRTGTVYVTGKNDPDYTGTFEQTSYLDDILGAYSANGSYDTSKWEPYLDANGNQVNHTSGANNGRPILIFKNGSDHELKMFYLERGGGFSNLMIHYNLISTTDFSAHKSYQSNNSVLRRNQYQFEVIGYDNPAYQDQNEYVHAIMPAMDYYNQTVGNGTYESPRYSYNSAAPSGLDVPEGMGVGAHRSIITGVAEDGNVNFGNLGDISSGYAGKEYYYVIRELIPDNAWKDVENSDGNTTRIYWGTASPAQRAEGGFKDSNGVPYDQKIYYFKGVVEPIEGQNGKYKLKKYRYLDPDYSIPDEDTSFHSFVNGLEPLSLEVVKKVQGEDVLLPDAEFSLTPAKMTEIVLDVNNKIASCKWVKKENAPSTVKTTENDGKLSFSGLTEGYYILEETAAPPGFVMDGSGKWLVKVLKQESEGAISLVPVIQALNADGSPAADSPQTLTVTMDTSASTPTPTSVFEVLNTPNTEGIQISVKKQWQDADMTEIAEEGYTAKFKLKRTKKEIVTTVQNVPASNATLQIGYFYSTSNGWWTTYTNGSYTYTIDPNQFKANSEVTINYDYKSNFREHSYKLGTNTNNPQQNLLNDSGSFKVPMPSQGQTSYVYFYAGNNNSWPLDTLTVTGVTEQPTQNITQTVSDEVDDEEFSVQPVTIEESDVGQFTNTYDTYDPFSQSGKFPVVKKDGNKTIIYKYYIEEIETTKPENAGNFETIYMIDGKEVSEAEYLTHETNYGIYEDASDENARTVINRKLIDIPITKVWPDYEKIIKLSEEDETGINLYKWDATLHLDYRDIPKDDPEHPTDWKEYRLNEDGYNDYTITLRSDQTNEASYFNDLPMYIINSQGQVCRREYSVVEKTYHVWQYNTTSGNYDILVASFDGSTVYPSGHRYTLWYEHDAGEDTDYLDGNYPSVNDYHISVYNMHENRDVKKEITVDVQKAWEGGATPPEGYKAKFRLKRKVLVEYRNYEYVTTERVQVTLAPGNGNNQVLNVPPNQPMFIRGILKEGADPEGIQFTRSDTGETLTASRDTTFAGYNLFQAEFAAPSDANVELTVTLSSDPEQISGLVVDGINGFLLSDSNDRQSFGVDATFSREFELSNSNQWHVIIPEASTVTPTVTPSVTPSVTPTPEDPQAEFDKHLPAIEISTLDEAGNTANIYIYTYFIEEVECTPDTFYPTFTDSTGKVLLGDENHQFFNTEEIIATNRPISFDVLKVDKNTTNRVLPGAKFVFRKLSGKPPTATAGGTFVGVEGTETTATTGDSGKITFSNDSEGLKPGCYYEVKETVAPSGYVLANPLVFYLRVDEKAQGAIKLQKIKEADGSITLEDCDTTDDDGIITSTTEDGMVTLTTEFSADGRTVTFTVKNEPGAALPHTGGPGTRLFTILGAILALGSGLILILRNGWLRKTRRSESHSHP